jgi:hypothetical protein
MSVIIDRVYWAVCHEDPEKTTEENEAAADDAVDPDTGLCECCGVDYSLAHTTEHLAALAVKYPNDVVIRSLNERERKR